MGIGEDRMERIEDSSVVKWILEVLFWMMRRYRVSSDYMYFVAKITLVERYRKAGTLSAILCKMMYIDAAFWAHVMLWTFKSFVLWKIRFVLEVLLTWSKKQIRTYDNTQDSRKGNKAQTKLANNKRAGLAQPTLYKHQSTDRSFILFRGTRGAIARVLLRHGRCFVYRFDCLFAERRRELKGCCQKWFEICSADWRWHEREHCWFRGISFL